MATTVALTESERKLIEAMLNTVAAEVARFSVTGAATKAAWCNWSAEQIRNAAAKFAMPIAD